MKLTQVLTKDVIHPDVKGLVINGKEVCPNGKIRDRWEGDFRVNGDVHQVSSLEGCPRVITNNFLVFNQKHLPNTTGKKGMLRCQAELIDAGYEKHAQL